MSSLVERFRLAFEGTHPFCRPMGTTSIVEGFDVVEHVQPSPLSSGLPAAIDLTLPPSETKEHQNSVIGGGHGFAPLECYCAPDERMMVALGTSIGE